MKRKTFCSVLLLLLPLLTLCSQEAYMGQIQITRRSFSLSGSQLHIQMEVNYEGLQMPSDESLTLTPFLLAGEQSFDLPSILINGAEKQKVYERTRVLGGASDTRNGRNSTPSVVLKNDRKVSRRFTYKVTVPFREWMAQANLMLHTEECGCNGREAATYDDRIASGILLPEVEVPGLEKSVDVRCLSWVNFIPASLDSADNRLPANGDGCITPECLFALANSYTPGSAEFNDIYDLAARLFPDCPEANINAAAVALSKRDTRKARSYLSRFSTRQTAFNNMGVLCMLEGNREKAELYLEMAAAAGVERASEVLEELRSRRNLY